MMQLQQRIGARKSLLASVILPVLFFQFGTNLSPVHAQVGNAGSTGLAFLKIGVGARNAALGEAAVAQVVDASAAFWNPAGLARARNEAFFSHTQWLQDIQNEFLAIKFEAARANWAIFMQLQNIGGIMQRQKPGPEPVTEISAHDYAFGLSYAREANEKFQLGATLKYVGERIWTFSASGFAVDLGARYTPSVAGNLAVSASLHNLGRMDKFRNERISLPAYLRIGLAYQPELALKAGTIQFFAAARKIFSADLNVGFGTEIITAQKLSFRVGYQAGIEAQSIAGGVGLWVGRYHLDYAYVPFEFDLGDTHRFSLRISL